MTNSNWTGRTARTMDQALGCTGHAIEIYRTPPTRRFFYAFIRHGWIAVVAALAVLVLTGCSSDIDDAIAVQADLADAIAQAGKGGIHE